MSVQMTCPYCKREFPFDNGKLDREISEIGQRICAINRELSEIKAMHPTYRRQREGRRKVLALELNDLTVKISQLKAVRKATDQQIHHYQFEEWKEIVKDRYGEKAYKEILELVMKRIKAYEASSLMRHEYSRSPHKSNITSINNL